MNEQRRIVIGMIVLGLLMPAIAAGFWYAETNRDAFSKARAEQAIENGDWETAVAYAEQANSDELRLEAVYRSAVQALEGGDYAAAEELFLSLGDYGDAQTQVQACRYAAAEAQAQSGAYESARDAFLALIPYVDAAERYRECSYRIAEQYLSDGDTHKAFTVFDELIPYADAEARATEIAITLTEETDPEKALLFARGYSEADWQHIEQIAAARSALTHGRIAVGNEFALFLCADGHADAVGDDTYGQCRMDDFQNVTAVAAGYRHSLALKADGTVVAAGDNTYGQCDVSAWTNVTEIACGAWDSYGVCTDGTVLHCGFSAFDLSGWTDVRSIDACATALIGLKADGSLLCTSADGRFPGSTYCDACITTGAAFALSEDGTVRCADEAVAAWSDLVGIVNSASVLLGLKADGSLAVHPLMPLRANYLNDLLAVENVAEAAPGGSFAILLQRDGTLLACGEVPASIAAYIENNAPEA